MSITPISTPALATVMLPAINQAQSQLATTSVEVTTGQYADLGLQLGAQAGYELSLRNETTLLQGFVSSNSIATTNLATSQASLDAIRTDGGKTLQSLTAWANGNNSNSSLQLLGSTGLASLISSANATSNGHYVFGGINSAVQPMADYDSTPTSAAKSAIDQAFQTTFGMSPDDPSASTISTTDLQSFLNGPFASLFQGTDWTTNWSSASSTNVKTEVAPDRTVETSTNTNQPGFQQLAQAYAMLSAFGNSNLSDAAQQLVASQATSLVTAGLSSLTNTEAGLGAAQQQITNANSSMNSQLTILQNQLGTLDNVDPSEAATKLMALQNQLQTAYSLTSRLHEMSLAQYLPVA